MENIIHREFHKENQTQSTIQSDKISETNGNENMIKEDSLMDLCMIMTPEMETNTKSPINGNMESTPKIVSEQEIKFLKEDNDDELKIFDNIFDSFINDLYELKDSLYYEYDESTKLSKMKIIRGVIEYYRKRVPSDNESCKSNNSNTSDDLNPFDLSNLYDMMDQSDDSNDSDNSDNSDNDNSDNNSDNESDDTESEYDFSETSKKLKKDLKLTLKTYNKYHKKIHQRKFLRIKKKRNY